MQGNNILMWDIINVCVCVRASACARACESVCAHVYLFAHIYL